MHYPVQIVIFHFPFFRNNDFWNLKKQRNWVKKSKCKRYNTMGMDHDTKKKYYLSANYFWPKLVICGDFPDFQNISAHNLFLRIRPDPSFLYITRIFLKRARGVVTLRSSWSRSTGEIIYSPVDQELMQHNLSITKKLVAICTFEF